MRHTSVSIGLEGVLSGSNEGGNEQGGDKYGGNVTDAAKADEMGAKQEGGW